MIETFTENPTLPLIVAAIVALSAGGMWLMSRHPAAAGLTAATLLFMLATLAVSWAVQTERERLRATIRDLAERVQANDAAGVLIHISPSAELIRQEATLEMQRTRFIHCWLTSIGDIAVTENEQPPRALVEVVVLVDVEESAYGSGRGLVRLRLDFQREADRVWRIVRYSYTVNEPRR